MSKIVTLPEAKQFLRISNSAIDDQVQMLLDSVEAWVEEYCGTKFEEVTLTQDLTGGITYLQPTVLPIVEVISLRDAYNNVTINLEDFRVANNARRLYRVPIRYWDDGVDRYELNYKGGYATPPSGLKLPILYLLRRAYESRGQKSFQTQGMSVNWDDLLEGDVAALLQPYVLKEFC